MKKYKVKRFSFWEKTKAGLKGFGKGAKYGALAGAVLVPGNVTLALLGKKKAAAITTAVGAGVGASIGGYLGAKESIDSYNYHERLKNDPEFRSQEEAKKKRVVDDFIKSELNNSEISINSNDTINNLKKIEKDYSVSFKSDLFAYIKFYEKFYKKNYRKWYESCRNLSNIYDFDIHFSYVFPNPEFSFKYQKYKLEELVQSIKEEFDPLFMVGGDIDNSDHSYLYYHFNDSTYSFNLGFGYDSKSISKTISDFSKNWKENINEIDKKDDPGLLEMVKVHNQIIDEFINGLKSI